LFFKFPGVKDEIHESRVSCKVQGTELTKRVAAAGMKRPHPRGWGFGRLPLDSRKTAASYNLIMYATAIRIS